MRRGLTGEQLASNSPLAWPVKIQSNRPLDKAARTIWTGRSLGNKSRIQPPSTQPPLQNTLVLRTNSQKQVKRQHLPTLDMIFHPLLPSHDSIARRSSPEPSSDGR